MLEVGVATAQVPHLVGIFGALFFMTGLPLIPLRGVWADKYSRKAVIVRSALVEAVVFARRTGDVGRIETGPAAVEF
ncbi:MAG TPA: hypothetical protein VF375_03235 [Candidatus Limnocylindrales bacterium]